MNSSTTNPISIAFPQVRKPFSSKVKFRFVCHRYLPRLPLHDIAMRVRLPLRTKAQRKHASKNPRTLIDIYSRLCHLYKINKIVLIIGETTKLSILTEMFFRTLLVLITRAYRFKSIVADL